MDDETQDALTPQDISTQEPTTPAPWKAVIQKPEFQSLADDQKEQARQQYYQQVVEPQVPEEYKEAARKQFDQETGPNRIIEDAGDYGKAATDLVPDWLTRAAKPIADRIDPKGPTGQLVQQIATHPPLAAQALETARAPGDVMAGKIQPGTEEFNSQARNLALMTALSKDSPAKLEKGNAQDVSLSPLGDKIKDFYQSETGTGVKTSPIPQKALPSEIARDNAQMLYDTADTQGGVMPVENRNAWLDKVTALKYKNKPGVPADTEFGNLVATLEEGRDQPLSYDSLDRIDKFLGQEVTKDFKISGSTGDYGRRVLLAQQALRKEALAVPDESLPGGRTAILARQAWTQQAKLRDIENILERAKRSKNPATTIQSQFQVLLRNAKRTRGWSDEELAAAEQASRTGKITDFLQSAGNRLMVLTGASKKGVLGSIIGHAVSSAARGTATAIQEGKAGKVADVVSKNVPSPYGLIQRIQNGETLQSPEIPPP